MAMLQGCESVACMTLSRVLLQLPVPEGFQPRFYHSLTATSLAPGITVVTAFGGLRKYFSDRIAETTLLQFGEYTCLNCFGFVRPSVHMQGQNAHGYNNYYK